MSKKFDVIFTIFSSPKRTFHTLYSLLTVIERVHGYVYLFIGSSTVALLKGMGTSRGCTEKFTLLFTYFIIFGQDAI